MIVHVVGAPGSGKTTLAQALARDLGLPVASVDNERRKLLRPGQSWPSDDSLTWGAMQRHVEANPSLIVETMGGTPKSERLLEGRDVVTVLVSAPDRIRHERIRDRARLRRDPMIGRPDKYVQYLTKIPVPEVTADAEWIGTHAIPGEQYDALVSTLRQSVGEASKRSPVAMNAVKFAEGTDNIIEGLAIPFGGPFAGKDLQGESFGPDTDLALEWFPDEGRPVIFDHGLDGGMKTALVGRQIERAAQDAGHWVKVQLDKRNRYFEQITKMVNDGLLSFSSGSLSHLVKVEEGSIKSWPWVELSLTPTPANPDAAVYAVKSSDAIEHIAAVKSAVPAPLKAAVDTLEDGFTEQPNDSGPEPFDAHAERVASEVVDLVERANKRFETRSATKAGRELSEANVEAFRNVHRLAGELLERSDKPTENEAEAAKEYAEYLRIEAAQYGALPV